MKQIAKTFARTFLNLALVVVAFGLVAHFVPMEMTMVAPEHGAAAESAYDKAVKRTSAKCGKVRANTFPTAAIVDTAHGLPHYTTDPSMVDSLFKVAVGEGAMPANVKEFKLCR